MRIFEHNFVADKAKFAKKTCAYAYEDRFLKCCTFIIKQNNGEVTFFATSPLFWHFLLMSIIEALTLGKS